MQLKPLILPFLLLLSITANTQDFKVHYTDYTINKEKKQDSAVLQLLAGYSDSLNKQMNVVIGFATKNMYNKQPESPLGNFMADCMKQMAAKNSAHIFMLPLSIQQAFDPILLKEILL